jgi:hypothetical protein
MNSSKIPLIIIEKGKIWLKPLKMHFLHKNMCFQENIQKFPKKYFFKDKKENKNNK